MQDNVRRFVNRCIYTKISDWLVDNFGMRSKRIRIIHDKENENAVLAAFHTEEIFWRIISESEYNNNKSDYFAAVLFEKNKPEQTDSWGAQQLTQQIIDELYKEG